MAIWTDDQINAVLAELGLRTPGEDMPPNPERIVAAELLTARQSVQDLTQQVLQSNTLYERTAAERDSLLPYQTQAAELTAQINNLQTQLKTLNGNIATYQAQRDYAYSMVRDLEVKVRLLQSQVSSQPSS